MTESTWGEKVHNWGLGLGTFLLGFGACIAAWQTNTILDKVLNIDKKSESIQNSVISLNNAEANIKDIVTDITKILHSIENQLKITTAKKAVAKLPQNPSNEEMKNVLDSLKGASDFSSPYLTNESANEVQKAWVNTKDPQAREEILFNALKIGPSKNQSNEELKDEYKMKKF